LYTSDTFFPELSNGAALPVSRAANESINITIRLSGLFSLAVDKAVDLSRATMRGQNQRSGMCLITSICKNGWLHGYMEGAYPGKLNRLVKDGNDIYIAVMSAGG
jgi:hypothetical protein